MRTGVTAALGAAFTLSTGGVLTVVTGTPPSDGTGLPAGSAAALSAGSAAAIFAGVAAVLLVLLLVGLRHLTGSRRRSRVAGPGRPGAGRPPSGPPMPELAEQAAHALVETDDAVRTSEQELGFATARFGEHATEPFSVAVRSARAELAAAFRLGQLLEDDIPESGPSRRSYLQQITDHCALASEVLDERSEDFDQLQDLETRAAGLAAEVDAHIAQQSARVAATRQVVGKLADRYTPAAITVVTANPDQATGRLEFAATALARARQQIAAGDSGRAAVLLQAAEAGADQATDLLSAVEHAQAELTQAASALPAALREIDAEIAEATAVLAGQPEDGRAGLVARAQNIASGVRAQQSAGPFDTLTALRELQQADTDLDHTLASVRAEPDRRERARAGLDQAMLVARSAVTAAGDFIATRRGAVGAAARTRLAEAHRHFQQAIAAAQADPELAVAEAQQADTLAQQARSRAEADVAGFGYPQTSQAVPPGSAAGPGGALLGGILLDDLPGGDRRGYGMGGDLRPGSFGGRRTRGRHSASGGLDTSDDREAPCPSRASTAGLGSLRGPTLAPCSTRPKTRRPRSAS